MKMPNNVAADGCNIAADARIASLEEAVTELKVAIGKHLINGESPKTSEELTRALAKAGLKATTDDIAAALHECAIAAIRETKI